MEEKINIDHLSRKISGDGLLMNALPVILKSLPFMEKISVPSIPSIDQTSVVFAQNGLDAFSDVPESSLNDSRQDR
ncbi:hypothetical protein SAMN00768000_2434 [Sulfobacillus thermosulfidooxidans DSM 9293]|uniref:Uncharacterized protein n=1 Tax=Sulfobacillus thermosulfidooxidans (strain DSM 9293 / VKM B-1269 / AT-1) TaxID=929705 RepID=A0A1W1WHI0_SULTA|nr:hypothetical protein SAMN00768000_2434 [Sulfobacillus thermosulfidooxidans DSM 9293]